MSIKNIIKNTYIETKGYLYCSTFICFLINLYMQKSTQQRYAKQLINILNNMQNYFAYYYKAKYNFYFANYEVSLKNINIFLKKYPYHVEGGYLKSQILYCMGNKENSWKILENILEFSTRLKTWLMLSKIVENEDDFNKFENLYYKYNQNTNKQITLYLIHAGIKGMAYKRTKYYLENLILNHKFSSKDKISKKELNSKDAINALKDIKNFFNKLNIKIFLVSGTFLGCIREGRILSHDYDIDIGIFNESINCDIAKAICKEGLFCIHEYNTPGIIKVKHINGILIDIFIHYKEDDKVYHLGGKAKWYNTLFELKEYEFLGEKYFGAKDSNLYLTENYGEDWRIPKTSFDNVLDTPNAIIINDDLYILHLYKLLMSKYSIYYQEKILNELYKYDENNFINKYKIHKGY